MVKRAKALKRREFTKYSTLPLAGMTGLLAGCAGGADSDGDGGADSDGGGADTTDEGDGTAGSTDTPGTSGEPLTIGGLHATSGALSVLGEQQRQGVELAIKQVNENGGVLGHPVEASFADAATDPVVKARRLIEEEADVLEGIILSSTTVQIEQLLREGDFDVVFLNSGSGSDVPMVSPNCTPQYFHTKWDNAQVTQAAKVPAAEHGGEWYFIAHDYNWGHDSTEKMKGAIADELDLESPDDASIGQSFVPLDQTDFRAVISKARNANPDVIGLALVGAGYTACVNQLSELDVEVPIHHDYAENAAIGGAADALDSITLTAGVDYTFTDTSNERGWAFAKAFHDEFGTWPEWTAASAYDGMNLLFKAVEAAGTTDYSAVSSELAGLSFPESIKADFVTMRACDHQAQVPIHVVEARNDDEFDVPAWYVTETLDNSDGQLLQQCGADVGGETRCNF